MESVQIGLRLPVAMVAKIDEMAAQAQKTTYLKVNRTMMVIKLLEEAMLAREHAAHGKK